MDTPDILIDFLENGLDLDNPAQEIELQRVHRLGKHVAGRTRPIIAGLVRYPHRERDFRASLRLSRESEIKVLEYYPKEIIKIRRKQMPKLKELQAMNIKVDGSMIKPRSQVKNLGSWFDPNLNMCHHITNVCKAGFFYLHNIRRIKKHLSRDSLLILVHAFIKSRLDYCNALLYGLPKEQIFNLRRVQNVAARLIMDIGKYSHITPALYELHWLPVLAGIHFKILLLAFKAIHGLTPEYICNLLVIKRKSSYNLRSNSGILLEPPRGKMLATLGERAFHAAVPHLWNELPLQLRTIGSVENCKNSIKISF